MKLPIFQHLNDLSEPTRVRLLRLLEKEELSVGELSRIVQIPQSTISRHLKVLVQGGWLQRRAVGTASHFSIDRAGLGKETAELWSVVKSQAEHAYEEDSRRLHTVLAMRGADSREFFGHHADRWNALRRELFGEHFLLPTLLGLLPSHLCIADIGCGTGDVLAALGPYSHQLIGIDRELAMLEVAHERICHLENVSLRQGSVENLPIDTDSIDAALSTLVLHHVENLEAAFQEVSRALKPDGRWVILDMQPHERTEFRNTLGHLHLGLSRDTIRQLGEHVGLTIVNHRQLPKSSQVLGPALAVTTLANSD